MTTLAHIETTSRRNSTRTGFGLAYRTAAIAAISGAALCFAAGANFSPAMAKGDTDDTPGASRISAVHPEPFLAAPRWTGSWSQKP